MNTRYSPKKTYSIAFDRIAELIVLTVSWSLLCRSGYLAGVSGVIRLVLVVTILRSTTISWSTRLLIVLQILFNTKKNINNLSGFPWSCGKKSLYSFTSNLWISMAL